MYCAVVLISNRNPNPAFREEKVRLVKGLTSGWGPAYRLDKMGEIQSCCCGAVGYCMLSSASSFALIFCLGGRLRSGSSAASPGNGGYFRSTGNEEQNAHHNR